MRKRRRRRNTAKAYNNPPPPPKKKMYNNASPLWGGGWAFCALSVRTSGEPALALIRRQ